MKAAGDFDVAVIDEAAQALEALNSHSGCPLFQCALLTVCLSLFVSRLSCAPDGPRAGAFTTWGKLSAGRVLSGF